MRRAFALAVLVFALTAAIAGKAETVAGGERLSLPSKVLGEERTIFIALPESYAHGVQKYPVLYLTDGQFEFDHTRTTAGFLARNGIIPEIIIVAVTNTDRTRDLYATRADFKLAGRTIPFPNSGNADQFLEFFEKELIPWTEANYRTAPLRTLAGHSAGGNFALHAGRVRPELFQAIIVASPWLGWDDGKELKQLVPFLTSGDAKVRTLFFTSGNEGAYMETDLDALSDALRARKNNSLRWNRAAYPNENHETVSLKTYYDGLRMLFAGWDYPRDPQTNFLKGSLDDVKAHYAKFGERLGYALVPPENTLNELGYQYIRVKNVEAALAAFRYNTELYPQDANVWDSLGDGLDAAGKKDEALANYNKAVTLAETNHDRSLETFKKHAARLAGATKPDPK